jgi:hypothetical protein
MYGEIVTTHHVVAVYWAACTSYRVVHMLALHELSTSSNARNKQCKISPVCSFDVILHHSSVPASVYLAWECSSLQCIQDHSLQLN